jgi:tetratricopeptide (TPR) repeat protein
MIRPSIHRLTGLALILALAGCVAPPRLAHWAPIRPVSSADVHRFAPEDGYYASAKAAIGRRDYAQALELLQAARAMRRDDVRILNAFGVVYDKLGRFDLSERYYAQARALDPASTILANNIAYSQTLQTSAAAPAAFQIREARATPPQILEPAPAFFHLAVIGASLPVISLAPPARPVLIADATGAKGALDPVRREMVRLGWSTPQVGPPPARPMAVTTIAYPSYSASTARALARTLPRGVELVDCGAACDRVRLSLGADATRWPMMTQTVRNP